MSENLSGPEAELISKSAENANARLRFFRLAFGPTIAGQSISGSELADIFSRYFAGSSFEVRVFVPNGMSRAKAKMSLLLLMCCETHMFRAGKLTLDSSGRIKCLLRKASASNDLFTDLIQNKNWHRELGAADVHFPLAREELQANGLNLFCDKQDLEMTLWTEPALQDLQINLEPSRPQRQGT